MQADNLFSVVGVRESDIRNNAIAYQASPFVNNPISGMQLVKELDLVSARSEGMIQQGCGLGIMLWGEFADFHDSNAIQKMYPTPVAGRMRRESDLRYPAFPGLFWLSRMCFGHFLARMKSRALSSLKVLLSSFMAGNLLNLKGIGF